jgi:hypothetical protein
MQLAVLLTPQRVGFEQWHQLGRPLNDARTLWRFDDRHRNLLAQCTSADPEVESLLLSAAIGIGCELFSR